MNSFKIAADGDTETADVWVDETFTNKYGDERAVIGGDSYGVLIEGDVKLELDWDITHHKFDKKNKEWLVDVDGLDHFAQVAEDNGFTVDTTTGEQTDDPDVLMDIVRNAESGRQIEVWYDMKNGNGQNVYEGEIVGVVDTEMDGHPDDNYTSVSISFEDTDGKTKWVRTDDHGDVGLFSGGYHPFMGTVTEVKIEEPETVDGVEVLDEDPLSA